MGDRYAGGPPRPELAGDRCGDALAPRISVAFAILLLTVPGIIVVDMGIGFLQGDPGGPTPRLSLGQVVRGGLFGAGVLSLVVLGPRRLWGVRFTCAALLGLGLVSSISGAALRPGSMELLFDLRQLFRALFGPLFIVLLTAVFLRFGVRGRSVLAAMAWYGAIAGFMIVGLRVTGVGLQTYGEYSEAFAGYFAAPNDTGLAMLLSLAGSFYLLMRYRLWRHAVTSFVTASGLLVLGTRAAVFGVILVPGLVLVTNSGSLFSRRRWLSSLVLSVVCLLGMFGYAAYQESRLQRDRYQAERLAQLAAADFGRIYLAGRALTYMESRPTVANVLGEGAHDYRRGDEEQRTKGNDLLAEVDWVDLLGAYGVLFTLLLYGFYVHFLIRREWTKRVPDPRIRSVLVVALLVYLAHASVAGHALTSPTPSGVLAPILAYALVAGRKRAAGT